MIHTGLDFLGKAYEEHMKAISEYERLRIDHFGELRDKVRQLVEQPRNSDESVLLPLGKIQTQAGESLDFGDGDELLSNLIPSELIDIEGIQCQGGIITSRNIKTLDGYNGNPYVFKSFFGKEVNSGCFSTKAGEQLEIQFEKEKADIIEKARYKGVRHGEGLLFQSLFESLGEKFKAIYLYSASGIQNINLFARSRQRQVLEKQGKWDYVDDSFSPERIESGYHSGVLEELKNFGIVNPENIKPEDNCFTLGANKKNIWKMAVSGNKSTRMIPSTIGGNNWPPEKVRYGSYDIAYAESGQAGKKLTAQELYKLAKVGGYIILPVWMLQECDPFKNRVNVLLDYQDGDFALLQKVS